jgi:ornithine cyclodeaminase/alanine dehydrogenase-like protein (mu-crystallin family)
MNDAEQTILRYSAEPYVYVDEETVHRALCAEPQRYLQFVNESLEEIARGSIGLELPPKLLFADPEEDGDFRVMPCITRRPSRTVKTVKLIGTNRAQIEVPDQITVGKAFCLHPTENFVSHIFEACLLSSARTGACAAVAVTHLAPSSRKVTIIGAGRVGFYAGLFIGVVQGIQEVAFADSDRQRAVSLSAVLSPCREDVRFRPALERDIEETDVLVLATTSRRPIAQVGDARPQLIVSLGADTEDQHEVGASWANLVDVYVDTLDSLRVGDLREWAGLGAIDTDGVTDLVQLVRGGKASRGERTCLFVSTGSALLDNLTIDYLLHESDQLRRESRERI